LNAAAEALSAYTDPERLAEGAVYPPIGRMQQLSRHVGEAVARQAVLEEVARNDVGNDIVECIDAMIWRPHYLPIRRG